MEKLGEDYGGGSGRGSSRRKTCLLNHYRMRRDRLQCSTWVGYLDVWRYRREEGGGSVETRNGACIGERSRGLNGSGIHRWAYAGDWEEEVGK